MPAPKKPAAAPKRPDGLVARVTLTHNGVIYEPGDPLPVESKLYGQDVSIDPEAVLARGEACDGSCDSCDCGWKDRD